MSTEREMFPVWMGKEGGWHLRTNEHVDTRLTCRIESSRIELFEYHDWITRLQIEDLDKRVLAWPEGFERNTMLGALSATIQRRAVWGFAAKGLGKPITLSEDTQKALDKYNKGHDVWMDQKGP